VKRGANRGRRWRRRRGGASGGAAGWTSRGKEFASSVLGPGLCFRVKTFPGSVSHTLTVVACEVLVSELRES